MQNDIYIIDYPFDTKLLYQEYLNAKKCTIMGKIEHMLNLASYQE